MRCGKLNLILPEQRIIQILVGSCEYVVIDFTTLKHTDNILRKIEFRIKLEERNQYVQETIAADLNVCRFLKLNSIFCESTGIKLVRVHDEGEERKWNKLTATFDTIGATLLHLFDTWQFSLFLEEE